MLLDVRNLGHQHLSAGQSVDLGQQTLERIPGGQAFFDAFGQIAPCVDRVAELVALVVESEQLLVARREANFFQRGDDRARGPWSIAAGAIGEILRADQELRYKGQLFTLLGGQADFLQQLANLDALGGGDCGRFDLEHRLTDNFAFQVLRVDSLSLFVLGADQASYHQYL